MSGQPALTADGTQAQPAADLRGRFRAISDLAEQAVEPSEFFAAMLRALESDVPHDWSIAWARQGEQWQFVVRRGAHDEQADREIAGVGNAEVVAAWDARGDGCRLRTGGASTPSLLTLAIASETPVVLQLAIRGLPDGEAKLRAGRSDLETSVAAASARGLQSRDWAEARQLLEAYGQLGEEYGRHRALRRLRSELRQHGRSDELWQAIHRSLSLDRTAYEIVAGWVRLTGCSRATLMVPSGVGYRVVAVSGVAAIDHRSPPVQALRRLAGAVAKTNQPVSYPDPADALPPQISEPLEAYLDWSHAAGLIAMPLFAPPEATADVAERGVRSAAGVEPAQPIAQGLMVVELADTARSDAVRRELDDWAPRFAVAIRNAETYTDLPLRRLGEGWRRWRGPSGARSVPGWLVGLATVAAAAFALAWIPGTLRIEASGTLQPAVIHNAFAPRDGYVAEIWVEHDQAVGVDDPLLRLESPDLELELKRTEGAIESTEKELRAAEAARRRGVNPATRSPEEVGSFAAEEERLRAVLASYQEQLALLRLERQSLLLRSPIEGAVLTWQVRQTLQGRPVPRGQRLLEIAARDSDWTLVLELPDRDAGHVLRARSELGPGLEVAYVLATAPGRRLQGEVIDMAKITEISESGLPFVEITVAVDRGDIPLPRAGAQARAAIDCGRFPLGYVWFYRAWDGLRSLLGPAFP